MYLCIENTCPLLGHTPVLVPIYSVLAIHTSAHTGISRCSLKSHDVLKSSSNHVGAFIFTYDDSTKAKESREKFQTLFHAVHVRVWERD